MSDGAGAVLLMKRSIAMQKGLPILGVFRYFIGNMKLITPHNIYKPISNWYTVCSINKEGPVDCPAF